METSATPPHPLRRILQAPSTFTVLAWGCAVAFALIIISGAAVRLTGSGLGCPDWPSCYSHHFTPETSIHPLVEFSNRMITGAISVLTALTVLCAHLRRPFRRDLALLSWSLLGGLVAEAVLGGIVVYTKLNPYLVLVHFIIAPAFFCLALTLAHRSTRCYDVPGVTLVPVALRRAGGVLLSLTFVVLLAGTVVTNAGPHAGNSGGQQVARRLPLALRAAVEPHAALACMLLGLVIGLVVAVEAIGAAPRIKVVTTRLLTVVVLQGLLGVLQYAAHLPAWMVELHIIGAVSVTVGVVRFNLELIHHEPEPLAIPRRLGRPRTPVVA